MMMMTMMVVVVVVVFPGDEELCDAKALLETDQGGVGRRKKQE